MSVAEQLVTVAAPPESLPGQHSFEWFSSLPAYRAMNRKQLESLYIDVDRRAPLSGVDVACGLGLMTELCTEIAAEHTIAVGRVVCVDLDEDVLHLARQKLDSLPAFFLRSAGQRLPQLSATADFVVIGNGIHNFSNDAKLALLHETVRVLRPGGKLFFNSSFYDGAVVEGTERFWQDNVRGAIRLIARQRSRDGSTEGSSERKPEAMMVLSPDQYVSLTREAGFQTIVCRESQLWFDQELMEAICDYWLYAQGALHFRYPAEIACSAMRQAAHDLYLAPDWERRYPGMVDAFGRRSIPRRVMWVTARKPGTVAGRA